LRFGRKSRASERERRERGIDDFGCIFHDFFSFLDLALVGVGRMFNVFKAHCQWKIDGKRPFLHARINANHEGARFLANGGLNLVLRA
jgi:hypothetical protein